MENIKLFNLQDGAVFVSRAEREKNPNAEYFTAQIETKDIGRLPRWECWDPDEVKSVTLTLRKTDKPEEGKRSAIVTDDGMTMLCDYAEAAETVELLGVLVGVSADLI